MGGFAVRFECLIFIYEVVDPIGYLLITFYIQKNKKFDFINEVVLSLHVLFYNYITQWPIGYLLVRC